MEELKQKYFKNDKLQVIPRKEKNKLEVLSFFASLFEMDQEYSEKEVNELILNFYDDYSIIRRYLVDYHFLERDKYGQIYKKTATN